MLPKLLVLTFAFVTGVQNSAARLDCQSLLSENAFSDFYRIEDREIDGRLRQEFEKNYTYEPVRVELSKIQDVKRQYFVHELRMDSGRAIVFFRYLNGIQTLMVDLIKIPVLERGKGFGGLLIESLFRRFPDAKKVHFLLDYDNRAIYRSSVSSFGSTSDQIGLIPTVRQLRKIGFTKLVYVGEVQLSEKSYPEIVLARENPI